MAVSVLALAVSLAQPQAGTLPACAHDLACIAAPRDAQLVLAFAQDAAADADVADVATAPGSAAQPVAVKPEDAPAADQPTGNEIVVEGQAAGAPAGDPAEQVNAKSYEVAQKVDAAIVEPIANAYDKSLPVPIRKGLGNFVRNLGQPISALNFLLQLKPGRAAKALGRFAINTTLGIGGLFDVAKKDPFNLPYEYNGIANTLGYYGIGPGPYLYLPFIGSTSVRDLVGRFVDLSILPAAVGPPLTSPYYSVPVGLLTSLESRIATDAEIDAIRQQCGDPYAANRDLYLLQRQVEIDGLRGRETSRVGKLKERLELNCDIEIKTGFVRRGKKSFAETNTNLIEKSETEEAAAAAAGAGPQAETPVANDPASPMQPAPDAAAEPQAPDAVPAPVQPKIRFESQPQVQPVPAL